MFGLLFVFILTTVLFSVCNPCSVLYTCPCPGVSLENDEVNCESLLGGSRMYINCFNTCIIPNHAFKTLPCVICLDTVYLGYNNISDVQPDAFTDLKELSVLYLNNNEIQELRQSTLKHIRTLKKLDVSFNRIRYIQPEAFVDMKLFYHLNISHNAFVLNGTILSSSYINILDASFCNPAKDASWYVLKGLVFSGLPNLTQLVLEGNMIQCVMWDTFSNNRRLMMLDLKNNMLKFMPHQITLCSHAIELDLSNNPLACNCDMKMYAASCSNYRVKMDEISCGTHRGLEQLPCDNVPLTDPPGTGICDFDIASTYAVTSALSTSEGTSQDNATPALFSEESEITFISLSSDKQNTTTAVNAPYKNGLLVEMSVSSSTEIPSTPSQNFSVTLTKSSLTKPLMWYVFGIVCVLVMIIVVVSVYVTLRVYRRQYLGGPVPATDNFNIHFGNSSPETRDKVDENYEYIPYNSFPSTEEPVAPKPHLHYTFRDVTTLPAVSANGRPETGSCSCSGILKTDIDNGCKKENLEEHVYEEVN